MTTSAAPTLVDAQRWLQAQVLRDTGREQQLIADDGIADRTDRLGAYVDAYRLRLLEVLGNDYPVLKATIGDAAFKRLGRGYIDAYPSSSPSARWYGRHFAQFLQGSAAQHTPALSELAAFEWAQGEVFDAADADIAMIDELAVLPGEAWPALRLELHPSARWLALTTDVPALLRAHGQGEALSIDDVADCASTWLLWRRGFHIHWRAIDDDEAAALQAVRAGANFGELCETLLEWNEMDAVALRAASLLKSWISDELIARILADP